MLEALLKSMLPADFDVNAQITCLADVLKRADVGIDKITQMEQKLDALTRVVVQDARLVAGYLVTEVLLTDAGPQEGQSYFSKEKPTLSPDQEAKFAITKLYY